MFKKIACTLIIAGFAAPAFGEDASLTVAVTEIKEVQGAIMMAVFNAEAAYEGGGPSIKAARIEVDAEEVSVTFEDLPRDATPSSSTTMPTATVSSTPT